METKIIIPLTGSKSFDFVIGKEFFEAFDNEEITAAELALTLNVTKEAADYALHFQLRGYLVLPCVRCWDDMKFPMDIQGDLVLRRGGEEEETPDGREIALIDAAQKEYDASQWVYDAICLSVPMQHCHPEGECNPLASTYLTDDPGGEQELTENPFAGLKDLKL